MCRGLHITMVFLGLLGCCPRQGTMARHLRNLKEELFSQINRDRARYGLPLLRWDERAAGVAEEHCREMLEAGYFSHWDLSGRKPYHRYALAGGTEYNAENLGFAFYRPSGPGDHINVRKAAFESYKGMLAERPPEDGHRRTILNPHHTHVGIGIAFSVDRTYISLLFLSRYVKFDPPPPKRARPDEKIYLSGKILKKDYSLQGVLVFHEPLPKPRSPEELERFPKWYGLPNKKLELKPLLPPDKRYQDGSRGEVKVEDERFSFLLSFPEGPGVYTVVAFLRDPKGGSFPATEVCIEVR